MGGASLHKSSLPSYTNVPREKDMLVVFANHSTCAWIQEVYGIDNATLWSNNPQIDNTCSNIYIGEVLCVDTNGFDYPEFNQTRYEVSFQLFHSSFLRS